MLHSVRAVPGLPNDPVVDTETVTGIDEDGDMVPGLPNDPVVDTETNSGQIQFDITPVRITERSSSGY